MTLSILFLSFCENCSWEILPMLFGAWFLGWLFWWLLNSNKYQNKINNLETDIETLLAKINAPFYQVNLEENEKLRLSSDLNLAQKQNQDFNAQLNNLRTELDATKKSDLDFKTELSILTKNLVSAKNVNRDLHKDLEEIRIELNQAKKRNTDLDRQLKESVKDKQTITSKTPSPAPHVPYSDEVKFSAITDSANKDDESAIEKIITPKSSYSTLLKPEELQIVEGIGPKIESLLNDEGINNWTDLANAAPSFIQNILNEAGSRYRVHDPKNWPKQAQMAQEDNWNALISFQKELSSSRSDSAGRNNKSKVEKRYLKAKGIKAFAPDDLKIVEGIGPKIEGLLKAGGINNWEGLARTEQNQIKAILTAAGERYRLADPSTWPKQAGLAAKGNWEELKAYQDRLKGGKE